MGRIRSLDIIPHPVGSYADEGIGRSVIVVSADLGMPTTGVTGLVSKVQPINRSVELNERTPGTKVSIPEVRPVVEP